MYTKRVDKRYTVHFIQSKCFFFKDSIVIISFCLTTIKDSAMLFFSRISMYCTHQALSYETTQLTCFIWSDM